MEHERKVTLLWHNNNKNNTKNTKCNKSTNKIKLYRAWKNKYSFLINCRWYINKNRIISLVYLYSNEIVSINVMVLISQIITTIVYVYEIILIVFVPFYCFSLKNQNTVTREKTRQKKINKWIYFHIYYLVSW